MCLCFGWVWHVFKFRFLCFSLFVCFFIDWSYTPVACFVNSFALVFKHCVLFCSLSIHVALFLFGLILILPRVFLFLVLKFNKQKLFAIRSCFSPLFCNRLWQQNRSNGSSTNPPPLTGGTWIYPSGVNGFLGFILSCPLWQRQPMCVFQRACPETVQGTLWSM